MKNDLSLRDCRFSDSYLSPAQSIAGGVIIVS